MRLNKPVQVFEFEFLAIGQRGFERSHWEQLGIYNDEYNGDFYRLTHNGVKFQQYVGVIQVGNLTIEILPKIGREAESAGSKDEWQQVLIDMLRECSWMKVHNHETASLQFKYNSILEAYLELYINECEALLRSGLIKKYRSQDGNCTALKGKLLFGQNIQNNLIHKENFYTRHQVYDRNNIFNQILLKALRLIPLLSQSPLLKDRVHKLLLSFPDLENVKVNAGTFQKLVYDRKSLHYREAMEIAAMLLLNYRPDLSSGDNNLLAILFDMNNLWEEYIYRQIQRYNVNGWKIMPQDEKIFWYQYSSNWHKTIKPDIVISNNKRTLIIDTKWKLPEQNIPDDSDLKQMFVYNEYWDGVTAILLYPNAVYREEPIFLEGEFKPIPNLQSYKREVDGKQESLRMHNCGTMKISVLTQKKALDHKIGFRLNNYFSKIMNG